MEAEKKQDGKQAIFNILSQVVLQGTNFILIMYFTRHLSTAHYGIVQIYQAYVLFVSVVVGLRTQGSIGPAFVHIDKEEHNDYLASILLLSFFSFVAIFALVMLFIEPIVVFTEIEKSLIVVMLLHCFGSFAFNFLSIKFVYERKAQKAFLLSVAMAAMMLGISFYSVRQTSFQIPDYVGRILGLAIPYILCGIAAILVVFMRGNPFRLWRKYLKFCLPICLPLIIHGISQIFLSQTDKVMLQKLAKDISAVGIYGFIVTFVHMLNAIYTALNNTWVPIYYDYTKQGRHKEIKKRARRYADFFTLLIVGFILVSPEFVRLFADSKYWGGITLIPILSVSVYMVFMYSFAVNYEIYREKTRVIAIGTASAALCNIFLNSLLIPRFSMIGAAVATAVSYVALYLFHEFYAKRLKDSEYQFSKSFFLRDYAYIAAASILFHLTSEMWYVRWLVAAAVGCWILYTTVKTKSIF